MKKFSGIGRYIVCYLLLFAVFGVYVMRLFQWQIIDGDSYYSLANTTTSSYIKLTATRGEILDRNGELLAQNRTCYNIVFDDTLIDREKLNDTILELIGIMEETDSEWIDALPIQLGADGSYSFEVYCGMFPMSITITKEQADIYLTPDTTFGDTALTKDKNYPVWDNEKDIHETQTPAA